MPEILANAKSIVMLTTNQQIDRRILLQAESLKAAGWKVIIVAMPLDDGGVDSDPMIVRVHTGSLGLSSRENIVLQAYKRIRQRLPMNGPTMRFLKMIGWRYFVDPKAFWIKLFKDDVLRYSPTIFVAHDLPVLPVAELASRKSGAKLVYDSHELYSEQEFSRRERERWAAIEGECIRSCRTVTTINQSIARELEKRYGIDEVKVILNAERHSHAPVSTKIYHRTFRLADQTKVLLFQGGLSANRNLETLVAGMSFVRNMSVVLVIMGDGEIGKKLMKIADKNHLHDRVFFHPAVPQEDLLTFTASADAGVIPYQPTCLNNYYCTPNKLYEFISAGIPIMSADLPELRNTIQHHRIGLVGDISHPEAMARMIDDFFSDEQRLLGWKNNTETASRLICWEEEGKKLVQIYEGMK